jgi:thioredoxin 1
LKGNFDTIINDSRPVIVDFHGLWCGPCKDQSPILRELAAEIGEKVRVIKIDVDQNNALASQYKIQSVPTLIFFDPGFWSAGSEFTEPPLLYSQPWLLYS